jgi:hypothetical protein
VKVASVHDCGLEEEERAEEEEEEEECRIWFASSEVVAASVLQPTMHAPQPRFRDQRWVSLVGRMDCEGEEEVKG